MANPVATRDSGASMTAAPVQSIGALVIMPQNFGEVMTFADKMSESRFVPASLRGKPADCLAVCLQALRWGMDPFAVAQKTYFIKDGSPPAYEAQLVNAVVYARAPLVGRLKIEWGGTWPKRTCTVTGHIIGDDDPKIRTVHGDLIKVRNSPLWVTDPDQQLAYVATRAWARLYVPDVLMGVYTPDDDEARSEKARDVTPEAERPRPTSRLDALEGIIDAEAAPEPYNPGDIVSIGGSEPQPVTIHDPETGEIKEPEPDIFPQHEPPQPSAEEIEKVTQWANETIRKIDTVVEAEFIDRWLAKNKDQLARAHSVNSEAAMAVVSAAHARKAKIEQDKFRGEGE